MPWKERYTISDEKSIPDADIKWPDGKRCCFRVVVDLSPACGPDGLKPEDLTTPDAYYGMNGGLDALVGVLDRYGLKATFAVPAATCLALAAGSWFYRRWRADPRLASGLTSTAQVIAFALLIGAVALPGAFFAKRFVERMPLHIHAAILDVAVIVGGVVMISTALRHLL